ncbi:MAG: DUF5668 domain-containing protein [Melioribacteraceae bacterium]
MKSKQLSWGFFLVTLGALFLLTKYNFITSDFSFVWDIWPLIFVIWGLMVIFKNSLIRPILSALTGIYLAVMIYGIIVNTFSNFEWYHYDKNELRDTYSEEYDNTIKYAELNFKSGAGFFEIAEPTDKLILGKSYGNWADYELNTTKSDSISYIDFDLEKNTINFPNSKIGNKLIMHLNEIPEWDLSLEFGAAKARFDLTSYKIKNVRLKTGASNVVLKLGGKSDLTDVEIEMGVAKIKIYIPKESGCRLEGDMVLMSRDLDGLKKIDSNLFETPNYENAQKKISIKINGGVSSFKLVRY